MCVCVNIYISVYMYIYMDTTWIGFEIKSKIFPKKTALACDLKIKKLKSRRLAIFFGTLA